MATPQPAIQIFSAVANGTHDWVFGAGASYAGDAGNMVIRASAIGSGAVGAIVSIYRGSLFGGVARYDDAPVMVFTLSGTNVSTASQAYEQTGDTLWRFVVSGITAATTVSAVCAWAEK